MAQILNQQFTSVFTREDIRNIPSPENLFRRNIDCHLTSYEIKDEDIAKCIDKLKIQKTPGPDQISPRVVKKLKNEIIEPLKIIFNKALTTGQAPEKWKLANVTPIFKKKGMKKMACNYRPISLTSIIGKLMETILRDQIVKQGSVLGPILFTIYINDIDTDVKCKVSKFADDTKLGYPCKTKEECNIIQQDLDKIVEWSEKWQMSFNVDKCKVMHVGRSNENHQYTMNNKVLQSATEEKDLGVIISNDMKPSKQCMAATNKANKILGLINRTFSVKK